MTTSTSEQELRQRFREDGFVALPRFLSETEVSELRENVARFIDNVAPTMPREEVFYQNKDDPTTLKQLQQVFDDSCF